jgi:flagellar hook-length control protein FliK
VQGLSAVHVTTGTTRDITIHLQPGTLGAVQVRIARAADGTASVTLQAEKPDTLHALQQDAAHLHQALDRAGLPSAGRQVTYELATGLTGGSQGSPSTSLSSGSAFSGSGSSANQNGQGGRGAQSPASFTTQDATPTPDQPRVATRRAAGLNITA